MKNITDLAKRELFVFSIIFVFAIVGMFAKLGQDDLPPLGSAQHAAVSREVYRTGEWFTLRWPHCETFNVFFQHPPLFFCLNAISFRLFGETDFAAKFVSALFGVGVILLTYYLGKLLLNKHAGFISAMVMILTPLFFKHSRKCELESILIFFVTLAFIFFILAQKYNEKYYVFVGLATGLGFLSKGPPALATYGAIFIYLVLTKRWQIFINKYFLLGILMSVITPLVLWIIPEILTGGDMYKKYFINQILWSIKGRNLPLATLGDRLKNYFYFFPVFFTYYLPWSIVGIFGIYRSIKEKKVELYLLICWSAVVWIGFTIAGWKDNYYLLVFWPGWSVLCGYVLDKWFSLKLKEIIVLGSVFLLIVFILVLGFTPVKLGKTRNPEFRVLSPYIKPIVPENEKIIIYKLYYWDMVSLFSWYVDRSTTYSIEDTDELKRIFFTKDKKFLFIQTTELNNLPTDIKNKICPVYTCGRFTFATNQKQKS